MDVRPGRAHVLLAVLRARRRQPRRPAARAVAAGRPGGSSTVYGNFHESARSTTTSRSATSPGWVGGGKVTDRRVRATRLD